MARTVAVSLVDRSAQGAAATYASISAMVTAESGASHTDDLIVDLYNDWSGNGLADRAIISGFDSTYLVTLRGADAAGAQGPSKPGGRVDQGFFGTHGSAGQTSFEVVGGQRVTLQDFGYRNTAGGSVFRHNDNQEFNTKHERCVSDKRDSGAGAGFSGFRVIAECCISYGNRFGSNNSIGFESSGRNNPIRARNCVSVNDARGCNTGTVASPTNPDQACEFQNLVVWNASNISFDNDSGGMNPNECFNNAASDGAETTPFGLRPYDVNVISSDFVDAANGDYHLSETSGLRNRGWNIYPNPTVDIDFDPWPDTGVGTENWDIGFDHVVSVAPPTGGLKLGPNDVTKVFLGPTEITKIYLGPTTVLEP